MGKIFSLEIIKTKLKNRVVTTQRPYQTNIFHLLASLVWWNFLFSCSVPRHYPRVPQGPQDVYVTRVKLLYQFIETTLLCFASFIDLLTRK